MTGDPVPLTGSERVEPADARVVGPADPGAEAEVTVVVRRRSGARPHAGAPLRREEFVAAQGADPSDLEAVTGFARDRGLRVIGDPDPARRTVTLAGSLAELGRAFGVDLREYERADGQRFRGRTGPLVVPPALEPVIEAILGLDDRPQTRAHFRLLPAGQDGPAPRAIPAGTFTPTEVASLYEFPGGLDGSGECIAILEFGGGYRLADVEAYFSRLGLPSPALVDVGVDGGTNAPTGDPSSADGEVMLDIEVAGAVAPAARLAVYFAPNSERGFLDAATTAIHDLVNRPSVISISWGQAESGWTAQAMRALDQAFQDAQALGVSVCAASGDDGSGDRVGDGRAHADFPASSPHALACGGTRLVAAAGGGIAEEVVWHDPGGGSSGGGVSDVFDPPGYQAGAGVPPSVNPGRRRGRGVPDVAGDADPATGYEVRVDGTETVVGGTSAVAPLWAALIALLNEGLGRPVGLLHPALYGSLSGPGFHDITSGSNGAYSAGPGWDACTGLGSPIGSALLAGLRQHSSGG